MIGEDWKRGPSTSSGRPSGREQFFSTYKIDSLKRPSSGMNWLQTLDLSRLASLGGDFSSLAGLGRLASEAGFCDLSIELTVTHE